MTDRLIRITTALAVVAVAVVAAIISYQHAVRHGTRGTDRFLRYAWAMGLARTAH